MQHPNPTAELIEQITRREFNTLRTRDAKSDPYIEGFRAGLIRQLETRDVPMPYRAGTSDADAYLAGKQEGRAFNCLEAIEIHETDAAQVSA